LKRLVTQGLVLLSVVIPQAANSPAMEKHSRDYSNDPRLVQLKNFFKERDCPVHRYAADFLFAADQNDLDWRLLPSISFVESTGGKFFANNNVFGWNSCKQRFPSVQAGIHIVAGQLGKSSVYKNKSIDEKLRTYNCRPPYREAVKRVMEQIGPAAPKA
jgi:hypothetical protein